MITNIEKEYHDYICGMWEQFSEETKEVLEPHEKFVHIYDAFVQASNQFLQNKLNTLESEKNKTS